MTPLEHVMARVAAPDPNGCRLWTMALNNRGQPTGRVAKGKSGSVRKMVYEATRGVQLVDDMYRVTTTCGVAACLEPAHLALKPYHDYETRFWGYVVKADGDGCWTWSASHDEHGYAAFTVKGRTKRAHRIAYELENGPIVGPGHGVDAAVIMHLCDNPGCVRPSHLQLGTNLANMRDMIAKGRAGWQKARNVS